MNGPSGGPPLPTTGTGPPGPRRLVPGEHADPVLVAASMAGAGRPVIPLWTDRRTPLTDPDDPRTPNGESGQHHRNLWHESAADVLATADTFPHERRNGRRVLSCSWGVVLGEPDPDGWRLVVLDTDSADAEARLVVLLADVPGGPEWLTGTMTVRTGRGFHRYGLVREPLATGKPWGLDGGLDLKALGGYVVMPGCRHPSGVRYADVTPEAGTVLTYGERAPGGVWQRLDVPGLRAVWSVPAPVPSALLDALAVVVAAKSTERTDCAGHGPGTTDIPATAATDLRGVQPGAAYARVLDALRGAGLTVRERGAGRAVAQCPAHDDREPSLSLRSAVSRRTGDGTVWLKCHAGCTYGPGGEHDPRPVLDALGLRMRDLYDDESGGGAVSHQEVTEPTPEPNDADDRHDSRVSARLDALRVQRDALQLFKAEEAAAAAANMPPFDAGTLAEVLARPPEPPHRVEGLILSDALSLVVAQRKTGKTTLCLNLARSLVTGEPFLDSFAVRALRSGERVALLNYEVSAALAADWANRIGVPADRLVLVTLRGRRNPLGNPADLAALAEYLRGQQVASVMADPFSRMFTGDNANDAGQVTAFLSSFDSWVREAVGASDVLLTAHAGWEGERARNSSALEDAPDSILTLTTGARTGDPSGRYLRALGRGVEVDEDRLTFDPVTMRLSMSGKGSRATNGDALAVDRLVPVVAQYVTDHYADDRDALGVSQTALEEGLDGKAERVRKAARLAAERGLVTRRKGARGAWLHFPPEADPEAEGGGSGGPERATRPTPSHPVRDAVSNPVRASYRDADGDDDGGDGLNDRDGDEVRATAPDGVTLHEWGLP